MAGLPAEKLPCMLGQDLPVRHLRADVERLVGVRERLRAQAVEKRLAAVFPTGDERTAAAAVRAVGAVCGHEIAVKEGDYFQSVALREHPRDLPAQELG